jgi:glycosyltransferase involved in cell wall biosynthesis
MARPDRILYVQYANPAGYPPLVHSIALLSNAGADIRVLGLDTWQSELGRPYPPDVAVRLLPAERPGWRQKVQYARFAGDVLRETLAFRPDWIYASDALAAPAVQLVRRGRSLRVLYHEHDHPAPSAAGRRHGAFIRQVLRSRRDLVRTADVCVLPNAERAAIVGRETGRTDVQIVWNCPRRGDAAAGPRRAAGPAIRFLYQGSIVPARLPLSVIEAFRRLDARAELVIAGYETIGHPGYVQTLLERAAAAGLGDRVSYAGVLDRNGLLRLMAACDVGLALFPLATTDLNESTMVGASNKAFEYLSQGLPLVVSDRPDWRRVFVEGGLARACDPASPPSVVAACQWFIDRSEERLAMGERGRCRVLDDWNYETTFAPVAARLSPAAAGGRGAASPAEAVRA